MLSAKAKNAWKAPAKEEAKYSQGLEEPEWVVTSGPYRSSNLCLKVKTFCLDKAQFSKKEDFPLNIGPITRVSAILEAKDVAPLRSYPRGRQ